jgi:hypothetical protein
VNGDIVPSTQRHLCFLNWDRLSAANDAALTTSAAHPSDKLQQHSITESFRQI